MSKNKKVKFSDVPYGEMFLHDRIRYIKIIPRRFDSNSILRNAWSVYGGTVTTISESMVVEVEDSTPWDDIRPGTRFTAEGSNVEYLKIWPIHSGGKTIEAIRIDDGAAMTFPDTYHFFIIG